MGTDHEVSEKAGPLYRRAKEAFARRDLVAARRACDAAIKLAPRRGALQALRLDIALASGESDVLLASLEQTGDRLGDAPWPAIARALAGIEPSKRLGALLSRLDENFPDIRLSAKVRKFRSARRWKEAHGLAEENAEPDARLDEMRAEQARLRAEGQDRDAGLIGLRIAALEELAGASFKPGRPPAVFDGTDCVVSAGGGTGRTALVFTGLGGHLGIPLGVFDRYLAERGVTAVYLRDDNIVAYADGIRSIGMAPDKTVERLRAILDHAGTRQLVTIGASIGAMGAVMYGVTLAAQCAVLFNGVMSGEAGFRHSIRDTRAPQVAARSSLRLGARVDLRYWLRGATPSLPVECHYGADEALDAAHAGALAEVDGVGLFPLPGNVGHGCLWKMIADRSLGPALDRAFAAG